MIKRIALITFLLLLTALTALAQGTVTIRRVSTVPASCDVTGVTSSPVVWKISGTSPGIYICIGGVYVYQTNVFGASLTAKSMLFASATPPVITSTAAPTNGQLLMGSTGAIPALGTLTNTASETLITNGAGSITIGMAASVQHKAGANWLFTDTTDTTKKFQFIASGITTANTRDVNIPDSNTFLPISSQFLTFTGPTAARTFTFPDATATIARTDAAQTFTGIQTFATIQQTATRCFLAADQTNATTTFANVTGCSINVTSGRKYIFRAVYFLSNSTAADGAKLDYNGGAATATNFRVHCVLVNDTGGATALAAAASTTLAGVLNATAMATTNQHELRCDGTFEPSSTSTFIPRMAMNASTTGTLTFRRGSFLLIEDMP